MADSPQPASDSADSLAEDAQTSQRSESAGFSELGLMLAPLTGVLKDFFRNDHPQHQQRLIGTWVVVGLLVGGLSWGLYDSTYVEAQEATWGSWIGVPTEINKAMIRSLEGGDVLTGVGDFRVKAYTDFLNKNEDAVPSYEYDADVRSWVRLLLAETRLRLALQRGYVSDRNARREKGDRRIRAGRNDDVTKAKSALEKVRDNSPKDSRLHQRALFGLAIVAEATCTGDKTSIDAAVAAYQKLAAIDGPYRELATSRRKSLENAEAAEFYQWFAEVSETPQTDITNLPDFDSNGTADPLGADLLKGLTGGSDKPSDPESPSETKGKKSRSIPDSVPLPGLKAPAEKKPAEKAPAEKKPAEKKPAEKKPAEKKPAEKKPAEKKPAEKKPAEKKPAEKKPAEKKPAEKKPAGKKPAGKKPAGKKPAAQKKSGE
jgi:hypothetical protein